MMRLIFGYALKKHFGLLDAVTNHKFLKVGVD